MGADSMFGRLAGVRIKAVQQAMAEGRLEDAFEIAVSRDLSGSRRVKQLLQELGNGFLRRGQDRLLAKRFAEAIADFDRAARCECSPAEVAEWQRRARAATQDDRQAARGRAATLASARQHLAGGRLEQAAEALAGLDESDAEAVAVRAAVKQQADKAREAVAAAEAALKSGEIASAVGHVLLAEKLDASLKAPAEIEIRLIDSAVGEAARSFNDGRLARAEQQLTALGDLGRGRSPRIDIEEALRLARQCAKALAGDRYARAGVLLGRLVQLGPQAEWIAKTREHLAVLDERRRALLEGPLGPLAAADVPSAVSVAAARDGETLARPPSKTIGGLEPAAAKERDREPPPRRILLRVDGGGSFLLIRGERVAIGRAGPGASADIQLISDLSDRQAEIVRSGEDYFVMSSGGVELAGRPADYALLQDGDRLRLGRHVRLTFLRPSKKSPTAVLELADGVRTISDCRRVILWSGPLLMGATRECHVRLSPSFGGAVLVERDGRLFVRPTAAGGQLIPVALGGEVGLGELRFSVQAWFDQPGIGRAMG